MAAGQWSILTPSFQQWPYGGPPLMGRPNTDSLIGVMLFKNETSSQLTKDSSLFYVLTWWMTQPNTSEDVDEEKEKGPQRAHPRPALQSPRARPISQCCPVRSPAMSPNLKHGSKYCFFSIRSRSRNFAMTMLLVFTRPVLMLGQVHIL